MKMKVQKRYIRKILFLLLLLPGGLNFSFPVVNAAVYNEELALSNTAEFNEQLQDVHEGSLPSIVSLNLYRLDFASALIPYQYLSSEEAIKSVRYIRFCRGIDPSLDATEIIYPFHFFL